jgi:hypothetical protein
MPSVAGKLRQLTELDRLTDIHAAELILRRAILQSFPPHLSRGNKLAQIRVAEITLRKAILKRFPAGRDRQKRLRWLKQLIITARTLERRMITKPEDF